MLNMYTTELMISFLTFFIAYVLAVTISGAFRAHVAEKMGDDTAASLGFATLNPVIHVDIFGVSVLIASYLFMRILFGWGRAVPINPFNIQGPHRFLKIAVAYLSDTFAYFISALVSIIGLLLLLGSRTFMVAVYMLECKQTMSHSFLLANCPTLSSLSITIAFIVISFAYLCVLLGALTFLINSLQIVLAVKADESDEYIESNFYYAVLLPMALILIFAEPIRFGIIEVIKVVASVIGSVAGLTQ